MGGNGTAAFTDRRRSDRFPIQEHMRYRTIERKGSSAIQGRGRTVDMSSRGVLFTTEGSLAPGKLLEVAVNWPAQLNGGCALQLVAVGHVVRVDSGCAAICIEHYEFRTRAGRPENG